MKRSTAPGKSQGRREVAVATDLRILLFLGSMIALPVQAAEQWFLMSRHGECAKIESLKRQIPVPKGMAYEVTVPEKELFLVFATSEMCSR